MTLHEYPDEPWRSFFAELDAQLDEPADLHCIGGFVVTQCYGMQRPTRDLDVLEVIPQQAGDRIMAIAGRDSPLRRGKDLYIDHVTVSAFPDSYESRLIRVFPGWKKLRLWALEAHDLAFDQTGTQH